MAILITVVVLIAAVSDDGPDKPLKPEVSASDPNYQGDRVRVDGIPLLCVRYLAGNVTQAMSCLPEPSTTSTTKAR